MPRQTLAFVVAVSTAVVLVSCGGGAPEPAATVAGSGMSSPTVEQTTTATTSTPRPAAEPVPEVLDFTAETVTGAPFDGASLSGKPAILWFWAPWCPVCRGQVSQVQKIAEDHKGAISVIGVGSLDDADAIRAFGANATDVTHLVDESGAVWKHFGVTEQSSFVLLDASGKKVFSVGYGGSDELDERVADVVR